MNSAAILQGIVIALIVGWSVLFAAHRLLPVGSGRVRARILDAMGRPSQPARLRALVRRLQSRSASGRSCGSGCSSCGGCAAVIAKPADSQPPMFRPRAKA